MTEITKAHAEWAVVDRLRTMLNETPHAEYNVTQSYGLCVAILAWVMQRVRTPESTDNSTEDRAAISVKVALDGQNVEDLPWALNTGGSERQLHTSGDFKGFTAYDFLKWLRDASCHGDARQVSPVNSGSTLGGFEFRASARNDRERTLVLTERDLRRIGLGLAAMYCQALQSAASPSSIHFVEDAQSMCEERIAA
ncbi:hypothetical protein MOLA814_00282 [Betaproteobacteria bacterium MOLA814]|nr:hypothetical protein MOLA814_00282 [Betaproteobacteria bacterium MOLA814]